MVPKRHYNEEDRLDLGEIKRRRTFDTVVRDVMKMLSVQELASNFEPVIRKVVREELERVIPLILSFPNYGRSSLNRSEASGSRRWQLHFRNKFPRTLFTGNKIEAENGASIEIVVVDAISKEIVSSGPLSVLKVEILVLDGDFDCDSKDDWAEEVFDASVIREREGKRPLVTGDLQVSIRGGVGHLGDVIFTDNSSWTRSRKFRLAARVDPNSCKEEKIREARSDAFMVKDHRGVLYKKHYPPSLGDEVWRLEKIGKDGAFHVRLTSNKINTVQDLLRLLVTDPSNLRSILGMSNKKWEAVTKHATTCKLDNKHYRYSISERQVDLIFDSVYQLVGAIFDGQSYKSVENLTSSQMILVDNLKNYTYRNLNEMVEIDWPLFDMSPMVLPLYDSSFLGSSLDSQLPSFPSTCEDQPATQVGFSYVTNTRPYHLEDNGEFKGFSVMQSCLSSTQRNSFKMKGPLASYSHDLSQWNPGESSGSVVMGGNLIWDDISQSQMPNLFPVTGSWGQNKGIYLASEDEMGIGFLSTLPDISFHMTRSSGRNMGWFKILATIKWVISVRRLLAARRRARMYHLGY
ncbi:Calmodulin binding protein-like [Thalictrum thalictroides]|uniref:Calmodulin binding protein-like n=1 Tax=Thalictrum thalictroides TaxID=46969 RepID=A0A7J6WDA2_THATH|nr:Calmodulin binding protein-like [Thalictrum thalictroides]